MRPCEDSEPDIDAALLASERAGLRIALAIRSALIGALIVFNLATQGLENGAFGAAVTAVFLAVGLIYLALIRAERDRVWMRYAFVALDCALLAFVAATAPLSLHGEVPQIFVFRVYGVHVFFFVLATSALSLSPRLVLWTGGAAVAAIWAAWGRIVLDMERVTDWWELSDDRTAERYVQIVLDPDMIATPNRVVETLLILASAAVTAAAVGRACRLLREQIAAERGRARVAQVFGRFVPVEVAETLGRSGGALRPEARTATIMFVDLEGFTRLAEQSAPGEIVAILDEFFDTVSEVAAAHCGVAVSLIGDAALVAFNAPLSNPRHAADALAAGAALLARVEGGRFAGRRLAIRIGVATGQVAAGTVGGSGRRAYTLYGDAVNLAQRLEAMNKETGTRLLVADATWRAAGAPPGFAEIRRAAVRGRAAPVGVYAPA